MKSDIIRDAGQSLIQRYRLIVVYRTQTHNSDDNTCMRSFTE